MSLLYKEAELKKREKVERPARNLNVDRSPDIHD